MEWKMEVLALKAQCAQLETEKQKVAKLAQVVVIDRHEYRQEGKGPKYQRTTIKGKRALGERPGLSLRLDLTMPSRAVRALPFTELLLQ